MQRSALTYWENEIPSRIDLGKTKYGGPFTTEEVEDVKTFLQLLKLLLSLSGILVASSVIQLGNTFAVATAPKSSYSLINALCHTTTVGFLTLSHVLFSRFCKYYL